MSRYLLPPMFHTTQLPTRLADPNSAFRSAHECHATSLLPTWVCHACRGPAASPRPVRSQNARSRAFEMTRMWRCSQDKGVDRSLVRTMRTRNSVGCSRTVTSTSAHRGRRHPAGVAPRVPCQRLRRDASVGAALWRNPSGHDGVRTGSRVGEVARALLLHAHAITTRAWDRSGGRARRDPLQLRVGEWLAHTRPALARWPLARRLRPRRRGPLALRLHRRAGPRASTPCHP